MPTPSDEPVQPPPSIQQSASALARAVQAQHATCPTDDASVVAPVDQPLSEHSAESRDRSSGAGQQDSSAIRLAEQRPAIGDGDHDDNDDVTALPHAVGPLPVDSSVQQQPSVLRDPRISPSPERPAVTVDESKKDATQSQPIAIPAAKHAQPMPVTLHTPESYDSNLRQLPKHTSAFLRNGSKFVGTQRSDRQVYNVEVDIKYVDMNESFICGYLRIEGLTADHPTLTTYFEGEIIGNKYSFRTRHPSWGSNEKVDMQHWSRFPAWRPLAQRARKPDFSYKDFAEQENIFMRWKESFLVPDHRVRSISGASFEGFYYICFNQVAGTVSGIYFHSKSEKFQQLELRHVDDHGCYGAMEFR